VRQQLGFVLQFVVLAFLPLVIGWQLFFGFPLLGMPIALLLAIAVFWIGNMLKKPGN